MLGLFLCALIWATFLWLWGRYWKRNSGTSFAGPEVLQFEYCLDEEKECSGSKAADADYNSPEYEEKIKLLKFLQKNSRICQLPAEVLVFVTDHLTTSSEASFVLTCKLLCHALGTRSWGRLGQKFNEKRRFLSMIALDLPLLAICKNCVKLHNFGGQSFLRRPDNSRCYADDSAYSPSRKTFRIRYQTVQSIMRDHRLGIKNHLPMMIEKFRYGQSHWIRNTWVQLAVQLKPVGHRLLIKQETKSNVDFKRITEVKQMLLEKPDRGLEFRTAMFKIYQSQFSPASEMISCHMRGGLDRILSNLFYCAEAHERHVKGCTRPIRSTLYRCPFCATEIQAQICITPNRQCTLVLTSWRDLGSGLAHEDEPFSTHDDERFIPYEPTPDHIGCIKKAFEPSEKFKEEDLHVDLLLLPLDNGLKDYDDWRDRNAEMEASAALFTDGFTGLCEGELQEYSVLRRTAGDVNTTSNLLAENLARRSNTMRKTSNAAERI